MPQRFRATSAKVSNASESPSTWRRAVLTVAPTPARECLHLYLEDEWKRILDTASAGRALLDAETSRFMSLVGGLTHLLDCDQNGFRVTLPDDLREIAAIEREVLWHGNGDRVELWNPQRWQEFLRQNQPNYANLWGKMSEQSHYTTSVEESHAEADPEKPE